MQICLFLSHMVSDCMECVLYVFCEKAALMKKICQNITEFSQKCPKVLHVFSLSSWKKNPQSTAQTVFFLELKKGLKSCENTSPRNKTTKWTHCKEDPNRKRLNAWPLMFIVSSSMSLNQLQTMPETLICVSSSHTIALLLSWQRTQM